MVECPTCGRDDFDSKRGMRYHHSIQHDESLVKVEHQCKNCNEKFETHKNDESNFCSRECQSEYTSQSKVVECDFCGEETEKTPSAIKNSNNDFCSKECSFEYRKNRVTTNCFECGKVFEQQKHKYEKTQRQFCSRSCHHKYYQGSDSPYWKETATDDYGFRWIDIRNNIRELDDKTCQNCELEDDRLHVHHVIPRREFDDVNDSNYKENLVTLCPSCHKTLENKSIREQLHELNMDRLDP